MAKKRGKSKIKGSPSWMSTMGDMNMLLLCFFIVLMGDETVLLYGHMDKQPEMVGWRADLGPWKPVYEDGKLYGRGSGDDGYAVYCALTTIAAIDAQGAPRPRCVGLIETCEESGSPDLPAYLDLLAPRLGDVQLLVGLDSGCRNYEQLWVTTSLRGLVGGTLTVEILSEGVHSGHASGIVPSSFRIARQLLNRIDDAATGHVLLPELHAEIPAERVEQAHARVDDARTALAAPRLRRYREDMHPVERGQLVEERGCGTATLVELRSGDAELDRQRRSRPQHRFHRERVSCLGARTLRGRGLPGFVGAHAGAAARHPQQRSRDRRDDALLHGGARSKAIRAASTRAAPRSASNASSRRATSDAKSSKRCLSSATSPIGRSPPYWPIGDASRPSPNDTVSR